MGELSKLPNIGKAVEEQLNKVGIDTAEKLRELGAERAWLEIQKIDEVLVFIGFWLSRVLFVVLKRLCSLMREKQN